jgi:hypothetical protein
VVSAFIESIHGSDVDPALPTPSRIWSSSGWARAVSKCRSANGTSVPVALSLHAPAATAVEYRFNGTFHTVRHDEFLIQTLEFEGAPDMVNIEYMWFEDIGGGRSWLCGRSVCPNIEARDALPSSGMEGGMTEGYERLDSLLSSR